MGYSKISLFPSTLSWLASRFSSFVADDSNAADLSDVKW